MRSRRPRRPLTRGPQRVRRRRPGPADNTGEREDCTWSWRAESVIVAKVKAGALSLRQRYRRGRLYERLAGGAQALGLTQVGRGDGGDRPGASRRISRSQGREPSFGG